MSETDETVSQQESDAEIWLVYSREHNAFWRPNARGYTDNIDQAGRYTHEMAYIHCGTRDPQPNGSPSEVAVLAPEALDRLESAETKARLYDKLKSRERGKPCTCIVEDETGDITHMCNSHKKLIEQARADERETCALAAIDARLPDNCQWGEEAQGQFEYGKVRAAAAIRSRKP